jgi:protein-S-isoprenylcysteine O-methyltransferase Ste14
MFVYAMSVNRFFSSVVRIQNDRGHHVVDSGPYAYVRHPGYTGMLLFGATLPLALGSWWAFLPGSAIVLFGFRRLWIEDRFLAANLPGYRDYAARVRYRLLPGIW